MRSFVSSWKVSFVRTSHSLIPLDVEYQAELWFRKERRLDPVGIPQFALVAEQVEKVNPDLVARDEQGNVYTVRY